MTDDWQQLVEKGSYVEVDGVDVHHFDLGEGEGTPLVLVHGGGLTSSAELNWGAVIERFAEHRRVIAYDQPGFGFTEPRGPKDYQPRERASFLLEFVEELGLESVAIAGNSEGSTLAAHAALRRPDLVDRFVMVNGGTIVREFGSSSPRTTVEEPTRDGLREELEAYRDVYFTETDHHPFWRELTEAKVDRYYEIERRNWEFNNARDEAIRSSAWQYNESLAYEGKPVIRQPDRFEVPALFAWSIDPYFSVDYYEDYDEDDDKDYEGGSPDDTYEFFKQLDEAQMHVWQGSKHHVQTDKAPEFVAVLNAFVDG